MYLIFVLLIPVLIGIIGLLWSKGKITIKEFLAQEGVLILIVAIGYFIARYQAIQDEEIWSGRIIKKAKVKVLCSHSYPCNPHPCGENGKDTCWDTCYEHWFDYDWVLYTSNEEKIIIDRVDRQGEDEPFRWTRAYFNEPTAQTHDFENYLKTNPGSVLKRIGAKDQFKGLLPEYPKNIYDYHYCDRFLAVGLSVPDSKEWNRNLQDMNADLGKKKQVNIIVLVVKTGNSSYEYALEEAWLGGKKNDLVVIIGAPEYPQISWVRIMSWSQSENLKVELRDEISDIGVLNKRAEITQSIRTLVDQKFVRRQMADFKYLLASAQPSTGVTIFLFLFGVAVSIGLTVFFYKQDPFGDEYNSRGQYLKN